MTEPSATPMLEVCASPHWSSARTLLLLTVFWSVAGARPGVGWAQSAETTHLVAAESDTGPERGQRLALDTAMDLASNQAPELKEPRAERQATSHLSGVARNRLHRPPRVEVAAGLRRRAGGGQPQLDAMVGVFQEFSLSGYGGALDRYASAAEQRSQAHLTAIERDARVRAGLAWVDARLAREVLTIRREALAAAAETLRVAEARVQSGRSSPAEAALARSVQGMSQSAVLSTLGEITIADASLRYFCGLDAQKPLEVVGPLDQQLLDRDEAALRDELQSMAPEVVWARAQATALERAEQLGRAASGPHLEVGPRVTREGTGDWIVLAQINVPLPLVDPAAADNSVRALEAGTARARAGMVEKAAQRDLEIAFHEREHAKTVRDSLVSGSIEPAREAARETQLQYEVGRGDLPTLLTARRELLLAQELWARASADVLRAEVRLLRWLALPRKRAR